MKIGIVGAGVSGIGAGGLLSQAAFDCEIFEQGSQVGGSGQRGIIRLVCKRLNLCMKWIFQLLLDICCF